jgi:transposase
VEVYVGMDVHRKRSQVAVLDARGTQLLNRNLPNDQPSWFRFWASSTRGRRSPSRPPTAGAGWPTCSTSSASSRAWSTRPAPEAIASARLKNDKVDARTLAHLLCTDLLPEAWIAPQHVRDQRALLRHRVALVQLATTARNRVHAVLADRGLRVEQRLRSARGRAWLAALDLPPVQRALVDDWLALIDAVDPMVARMERDLRARAKPDPRVGALMALPGVGWITAMTLLAELGDVGRFATARKLCAWAGLIPAVRNLRPHRPPRPHHQAGLPGGALGPLRGRPAGQDPTAVRPLLRRVCSSPRPPHRHRRGRPQAARPRLPHPQGGRRHRHQLRRRSPCRVRSRVSMRLKTRPFP